MRSRTAAQPPPAETARWYRHLKDTILRRERVQTVDDGVVRERVLVLDKPQNWWAWLPVDHLVDKVGTRARYRYGETMHWRWIGAGIASMVAFVVAFMLFQMVVREWNPAVPIIALFFGIPIGGPLGFIYGSRLAPGSIWVVARVWVEAENAYALSPVTTRPLLSDYDVPVEDDGAPVSDAHPMVFRADAFYMQLKQMAWRKMVRHARTGGETLQVATIIVGVVAVIGIALFFMLARSGGGA